MIEEWADLKKLAIMFLKKKKLGQAYADRLKVELKEIDKQGAGNYWTMIFNERKKYDHNKNGLVLPFLLGLTSIDPIQSNIPHNWVYHADFPDIDIDFLSQARDPVKEYAAKQYGIDRVCSVGNWNTYKPKLALQDAASALGLHRNQIISWAKDLPKEFDEMDFKEAISEFDSLQKFYEESELNKEVVDLAYRMVGKIRSQGRHAGGLIIADVSLKDYIPMTLSGSNKGKEKQWTSAWTEGMAASQLSKFGLVKFDILGLTNQVYIWTCQRLVQQNRGIIVDFDDMNPEEDRAGWMIHDDGRKEPISLNDPKALAEADAVRVDSVFQFDTDFAKGILEKGGVKSFNDLLVYTSLGRPGPLPMIDVYIENRDDPDEKWRQGLHPDILKILEKTYGIIVFQEDLARFWTELCGFTIPEAQDARKAVAKKKTDQLQWIGPKVIKGATPLLGEEKAKEWWDKMVSFGRYAFNKSHATAYTILAYRCLWLKTYFPSEWWAAVLSDCKKDKLVQFIGTARCEGMKFGTLSINRLAKHFTVKHNKILLGLTSVNGIGDSAADKLLTTIEGMMFNSFDEVVDVVGPNRTIFERLIKLGAFDELYPNRKALWKYYLYKVGSGKDINEFKRRVNACYLWPSKEIFAERQRQTNEYKKQYPKRKKIPKKIMEWLPSNAWPTKSSEYDPERELTKDEAKMAKKIKLTFDQFVQFFPEDFSLIEILDFEKEYLGYYWNSPLEVFENKDGTSVADARASSLAKQAGEHRKRVFMEAVIDEVVTNKTKSGNEYLVLYVTDGIERVRVNVWGNEIFLTDDELFEPGTGIRMCVKWSDQYRSFSVERGQGITALPLKKKKETEDE